MAHAAAAIVHPRPLLSAASHLFPLSLRRKILLGLEDGCESAEEAIDCVLRRNMERQRQHEQSAYQRVEIRALC